MIRYYPAGTDRFLVTARRKPRGYIEWVTRNEHRVVTVSRFEAYTEDRTTMGWTPVSFNGYREKWVFQTREQAAKYLLSCVRYRYRCACICHDPEYGCGAVECGACESCGVPNVLDL